MSMLGRGAVSVRGLGGHTPAAEILGKLPVSSDTGARNECEGGAMKNKKKARDLLRRLGFSSGVHRPRRFAEGDRPAREIALIRLNRTAMMRVVS
jgi:hypothetical protein